MGGLYTKPYFYIPVILIAVIAIFVVILLSPNGKTPARIHSLSGDVTVDAGSGFSSARTDDPLSENDIVRTGPQSEAIIVLYDKVIVRLKENTQVIISELSSDNQALAQQSGTIWTKVAKLGGKEEFSIQTPTTTATVRGTVFRTSDGTIYELIVGEGVVEAGGIRVYKLEKLVGENGSYTKMNLTEEEKAELTAELISEVEVLQALRLREVLKNDMAMSFVRSTYGATEEQIAQFLLDIDSGKESEDTIRDNAPIDVSGLDILFSYNAEIKNTLAVIKAMNGE